MRDGSHVLTFSYCIFPACQYAVRLKHERIVQSLLEENVNPTVRDQDGLTPAVHAVQDEVPAEILSLLESYGATDIDQAKSDRMDLFERVTATQSEREERREKEQQKEALLAQAKMSENMRLLNERGEKSMRLPTGHNSFMMGPWNMVTWLDNSRRKPRNKQIGIHSAESKKKRRGN